MSLLLRRSFRAAKLLGFSGTARESFRVLIGNLFAQRFILRRDPIRWAAHFLVFIGGGGLVLLHGLPRLLGTTEYVIFPWAPPLLRIAAHDGLLVALVLGTSVFIVLRVIFKRLPAAGLRTHDLVPLAMLASIGVTGLLSWQLEYVPALYEGLDTMLRRGVFFTMHALTTYVIIATFMLTRLFHWFVRLASFPVSIYRLGYQKIDPTRCKNCEREFAPAQQVEDVAKLADDVRSDLIELCPDCRRKAQLKALRHLLRS